jgi:hypothetical protein
MKQLISAFALMFLAISASVLASRLNVKFAQFDTNSDGEISRLEAKNSDNLFKQFSDLDENCVEMLSEGEFEQLKR